MKSKYKLISGLAMGIVLLSFFGVVSPIPVRAALENWTLELEHVNHSWPFGSDYWGWREYWIEMRYNTDNEGHFSLNPRLRLFCLTGGLSPPGFGGFYCEIERWEARYPYLYHDFGPPSEDILDWVGEIEYFDPTDPYADWGTQTTIFLILAWWHPATGGDYTIRYIYA